MNLFYAVQNKHRCLTIGPGLEPVSGQIDGQKWRGLAIEPGARPQLRVVDAADIFPFRDRPESVGWKARASGETAKLRVGLANGDDIAWGPTLGLRNGGADVLIPWAEALRDGKRRRDLVVFVPPSSAGAVFLGAHKLLSREALIAQCVGEGVELGPGPKPQVLPSDTVSVRYVEQLPPDQWETMYGAHYKSVFNPALAPHYIVGEAHDIPVADESLDFIFLSHVFEHLANPLRHLELWANKLKPGGRAVAVVPDLAGSKDYFSEPSSLADLVAEYDAASMRATPAQFEHYAKIRGNPGGGPALQARGFSVHVHFYSNANTAALLREAQRRFGYRDFTIVHTPNHKDFYFTLVK